LKREILNREKEDLRRKFIRRRQDMAPEEVKAKSREIIKKTLTLCAFAPGDFVGLYLPVRNEVDTWPLFEHLLHIGAYPLLPCCRENEPGKMDFFLIRDKKELRKGKFGIQEPCIRDCPAFDCGKTKALILPGVAFDLHGYRLGFGGGYYDRFLGEYPLPLLIGLAYEFQIAPQLPAEPWDRPVQYVITETRTRSIP
jgi:5-formyltetrahydrofolate cyclo-ligase